VAVATAISAKEAESRANHDTALEKAVESGRRGGTMKLRLKDTQLVKAQNRVKELEKQIEDWRKAGSISSETTGEPSSLASAPTDGSPTAPVPSPSASAPSPTNPAPPRGAAGATAAPPTRKPSIANVAAGRPAAAAAATAAGQPARGRGRGTVRGQIGIRGAAAPGVGRGTGAPPQGPPVVLLLVGLPS
jgi:nucleoprotein TPR